MSAKRTYCEHQKLALVEICEECNSVFYGSLIYKHEYEEMIKKLLELMNSIGSKSKEEMEKEIRGILPFFTK